MRFDDKKSSKEKTRAARAKSPAPSGLDEEHGSKSAESAEPAPMGAEGTKKYPNGESSLCETLLRGRENSQEGQRWRGNAKRHPEMQNDIKTRFFWTAAGKKFKFRTQLLQDGIETVAPWPVIDRFAAQSGLGALISPHHGNDSKKGEKTLPWAPFGNTSAVSRT